MPDSQEWNQGNPINIAIQISTIETCKLNVIHFFSYINLQYYLIDWREADVMIQKLSKLHQH